MRRQRLLLTVSLLSLTLCAGTVALWVRSCFVQDEVTYSTAYHWRAVSARGGLFVERLRPHRRHGTQRQGYLSSPPYSDTVMHDRNWEVSKAAEAGTPPPPPWRWTVHRFRGLYLQGWFVHTSLTNRPPWRFPLIPRAGPTQWVGGLLSTTADPNYVTEYWYIGHELWVPYWLMTSALAALPAAYVRRHRLWRRHARLRAGLCPQCGYNLTGNASGVCPECGKAAPTRES